MPTYLCYVPRGAYNSEKKHAIAESISRRHSEATGAPAFFVQVMIEETSADRYLSGSPAAGHIWIRGDIRAGRTVAQRTGLMQNIMQDVSQITSVDESNIWVYLCNLEPTDMIEYGHVLPTPGQEAAWFAALPESLRKYLEKLGTTQGNFKL